MIVLVICLFILFIYLFIYLGVKFLERVLNSRFQLLEMTLKNVIDILVNWYFNNLGAQALVAIISASSIVFYVVETYTVADADLSNEYIIIVNVSGFFVLYFK